MCRISSRAAAPVLRYRLHCPEDDLVRVSELVGELSSRIFYLVSCVIEESGEEQARTPMTRSAPIEGYSFGLLSGTGNPLFLEEPFSSLSCIPMQLGFA